jgi:5-methylcytosine-specific restriction endonuclease McrA
MSVNRTQYRARWRADHVSERKAYRERRYRSRRLAAVLALGGKCVVCGSTEHLEFDHVDRARKTANMDALFRDASHARINAELTLCQLLCESCHGRKSRYEYLAAQGEQDD